MYDFLVESKKMGLSKDIELYKLKDAVKKKVTRANCLIGGCIVEHYYTVALITNIIDTNPVTTETIYIERCKLDSKKFDEMIQRISKANDKDIKRRLFEIIYRHKEVREEQLDESELENLTCEVIDDIIEYDRLLKILIIKNLGIKQATAKVTDTIKELRTNVRNNRKALACEYIQEMTEKLKHENDIEKLTKEFSDRKELDFFKNKYYNNDLMISCLYFYSFIKDLMYSYTPQTETEVQLISNKNVTRLERVIGELPERPDYDNQLEKLVIKDIEFLNVETAPDDVFTVFNIYRNDGKERYITCFKDLATRNATIEILENNRDRARLQLMEKYAIEYTNAARMTQSVRALDYYIQTLPPFNYGKTNKQEDIDECLSKIKYTISTNDKN